ncbi:MAG: ABC transporter permease [Deltaproteobacteria bacterium]|nr:ABC transporter permease [Candidatus Anaeroferrophillus wilburensis]MBN2888036.1 ABC transporter permease [Deltaproteobacteria bacterium]
MARYLIKRLLTMIPTIIGVVTMVFFLVHLIPGDPVTVMLGEHARAVEKAALRQQLGLDLPLWQQYWSFLKGIATGNLGVSFFYRQPVAAIIAARLPATILLAGAAMGVALLIALPLGVLAASRQYSGIDNLGMFFSLLGISMPNFWLGPLLIILFSLKLNWLPVSGMDGLASLILPAITLGTALAAILSRMTRSSLLEEMAKEYLTAARARGLPAARVILKHALKNALLPVVTIVGLQFGSLLSGAIVTEKVFSWPGIGSLLIQAVFSRDYPMVQGCILVISFCYIIANVATELFYALVDPRIRYD